MELPVVLLREHASEVNAVINVLLTLIAFVSLVVACRAARAAQATYRIAQGQYSLSIRPLVTAQAFNPVNPDKACGILVMNHGIGDALEIELDLEVLRGGATTGSPANPQVLRSRVRDLFGKDSELVAYTHAGSGRWSDVWGKITYKDAESKKYRSQRSQGQEGWTHQCLG